MKKVSFFLSALAMVAFVACNNAAEEAAGAEPVNGPVDSAVVDTTAVDTTTVSVDTTVAE